MRNFVIINGCPSSIVASNHRHAHFLIHKKPSFSFLSLHSFNCLSLSKPISLIPPSSSSTSTPLISPLFYPSNFNPTKFDLHFYAEIASKLVQDGKFEDFGLVVETVLTFTESVNGSSGFGELLNPKLVVLGILKGLRRGRFKDVIGVVGCLAQLNVDVLSMFVGLSMELLKGGCFRMIHDGLIQEAVELLDTFACFQPSIGDLIKPSDLIKTSADNYSLSLAVRSEGHSSGRSVGDSGGKRVEVIDRRRVLLSSVGSIASCLLSSASFSAAPSAALAASSRSEFADMPALRGKDYGKTKMRYPDYTETETGLQYKDLRVGTGPTPKIGETVVVDWDGYTIGYYGRIFEARNKTKGGSFEGDDKDFFKFKIGSQEVIPAFEEAVVGMSLGGIRRIIVPPELGYPDNDYNQKGPRPTTFSGQRALSFVLRNQGLIDKTLLFDIELLKIVPI